MGKETQEKQKKPVQQAKRLVDAVALQLLRGIGDTQKKGTTVKALVARLSSEEGRSHTVGSIRVKLKKLSREGKVVIDKQIACKKKRESVNRYYLAEYAPADCQHTDFACTMRQYLFDILWSADQRLSAKALLDVIRQKYHNQYSSKDLDKMSHIHYVYQFYQYWNQHFVYCQPSLGELLAEKLGVSIPPAADKNIVCFYRQCKPGLPPIPHYQIIISPYVDRDAKVKGRCKTLLSRLVNKPFLRKQTLSQCMDQYLEQMDWEARIQVGQTTESPSQHSTSAVVSRYGIFASPPTEINSAMTRAVESEVQIAPSVDGEMWSIWDVPRYLRTLSLPQWVGEDIDDAMPRTTPALPSG
ncbi:MAG: hypothetical protein A3F41_05485 [Coxiella sp. RIFCSPHIGHO2_12_FULL_44_14]|nr:MAG: hypothetical protein A3F41_05485 [Coxiella sp. RIFCSPHIGHO2_12_FULL_44_14]